MSLYEENAKGWCCSFHPTVFVLLYGCQCETLACSVNPFTIRQKISQCLIIIVMCSKIEGKLYHILTYVSAFI